MPETWFISDTHFGHKNILEYEKESRPFETIEEMNESIIHRWNSVVGDKDLVFHLGDVCFGKRYLDSVLPRLKGKKRLVMGNHDTYPSQHYLMYFDKLYGVVFWERCVLSHMPVHPNGLGARWLLNVHGHLHSRNVRRTVATSWDVEFKNTTVAASIPMFEENDPNYFNVSCEQNNLTPINADVIRERIKELQ